MKSNPYLIAETAFHHEGDMDYMTGLIEAAARAKCDAIKFQVLIDFEYLVNKNHGAYDTLKNFTFTIQEWQQFFDIAVANGLRVISLPLDTKAVHFTKENESKVDLIEIHSVSFYDELLIDAIKKSRIPVFLGVGGRTTDEIDGIKDVLGKQLWGLIVGFQAFPSKLEDIKLGKISYLINKYPELQIGYTDHSSFDDTNAIISNYVALGMGATFFEKHLTLSEGVERTDFQSAIGEEKLTEINKNLKQLSNAVFKSSGNLNEIEGPEINYRNRQKKAFTVVDIKKGEKFKKEDFNFQMTDIAEDGFYSLSQLVGKTAGSDISAESFLRKTDIYE